MIFLFLLSTFKDNVLKKRSSFFSNFKEILPMISFSQWVIIKYD